MHFSSASLSSGVVVSASRTLNDVGVDHRFSFSPFSDAGCCLRSRPSVGVLHLDSLHVLASCSVRINLLAQMRQAISNVTFLDRFLYRLGFGLRHWSRNRRRLTVIFKTTTGCEVA